MAWLDVVQDVREEDQLELIEMEGFANVEKQFIGIYFAVVLRYFV